jgi:uncharacterized glyoxalase superfamily protein PhnB
VLDQINLVVRDMAPMVEFYARLGVDMDDTLDQWVAHHRSAEIGEGVALDLDSSSFAVMWNQGWRAGATGAVIGFRLGTRDAVDELYSRMTGSGARGQQEPYDAFWGSRYAVIEDPEGNAVGLMSPPEESRRTPPPDPPAG